MGDLLEVFYLVFLQKTKTIENRKLFFFKNLLYDERSSSTSLRGSRRPIKNISIFQKQRSFGTTPNLNFDQPLFHSKVRSPYPSRSGSYKAGSFKDPQKKVKEHKNVSEDQIYV